MEKLTKIFIYASIASVFFPIGLYFYKKKFDSKVLNVLAYLLLAAAISDILLFIMAKQGRPGVAILNSYFIVQFIFVSIIYFHLYLNKPNAFLKVLTSLGLVVILTNWIFWQGIDSVQNFTWASTSILIAAMALGYFSHLAKFPVENLKQYGPFWISTGLLFYCCVSFAILAFSRVFAEKLEAVDFNLVWMFHNINNIFKNVCFFLAVWWANHRTTTDLPIASKN